MVLPEVRHSQPQHHRSGVHSLLRGGKGPSLENAILAGTPVLGYPNTPIVDGFGRRAKSVANEQIPAEEPPYRTPFSLSTTTGATGFGSTEDLEEMGLSRNGLRSLRRRLQGFVWGCKLGVEGELNYKEKTGALSRCLVPEEVTGALRTVHDTFPPAQLYSARLTGSVGPSVGETLPDVESVVVLASVLGPAVILETKAHPEATSVRYGWHGLCRPIQPTVQDNWSQIHIGSCGLLFQIFDYKRLRRCGSEVSDAMLLENAVPVFGWPCLCYCDNGSHFTGSEVMNMSN